MNQQHLPDVLRSAGLSIHPSLGQVKNGSDSIALGPVNMKVLMLLLSRPGDLISRNEFFKQVWGEQIVSDDALTRCISDLRSELGPLCPKTTLIETLPKRGYRWTPAVQVPDKDHKSDSATSVWWQYIGFIIISTIIVGALFTGVISILSPPTAIETVQVVLMPPQIKNPDYQDLAIEPEDSLKHYLLATPNVRFLSQRALSTATSNYVGYAREFNVEWIIESSIREKQNGVRITLSLVDPYTSLVVHTDYLDIANHPSELNNLGIRFTADISKMLQQRDRIGSLH